MATIYQFDEAEANLATVLDQLEAGEKVSITRSGGRVLRLVAETDPRSDALKRRRAFGSMKGQFKFDESFFDPLPEEELRAWEGRDD